jgi:hypothetical protein
MSVLRLLEAFGGTSLGTLKETVDIMRNSMLGVIQVRSYVSDMLSNNYFGCASCESAGIAWQWNFTLQWLVQERRSLGAMGRRDDLLDVLLEVGGGLRALG